MEHLRHEHCERRHVVPVIAMRHQDVQTARQRKRGSLLPSREHPSSVLEFKKKTNEVDESSMSRTALMDRRTRTPRHRRTFRYAMTLTMERTVVSVI